MTQPNIILILTDHFRRDALGPSTPNLLALANSGTRFDNAYCTSPLCGPSRVSLITGLYPSQHGVSGNQAEPIRDDQRDDTFMHHLQAAGYTTAMVGKHHYIDRFGLNVDCADDTDELKRYGFDHVFVVVDDGENGHNDDEYTRHLRENGKLEQFRAALSGKGVGPFEHPFSEDESADGFIGLHGIRFVEDVATDAPFYLNLSFIGPHPPLWHPGELAHDPAAMPAPIGAPDSEATRLKRAHYMDKCALIDRYVGRLVETLKARGLFENTVFIFTSDHGDNLGDYGIWDKRFFYEQSVGVPLFICGPGVPAQERRNGPRISKVLASHNDLYATILSLAGTRSPNKRPGRDLIGVLRGEPAHDAIYAELATLAMIRTGNWKLVFDPEQGGVQYLFNLAIDPHEQQNLAGVAGYEAVTLDLVQRLLGYRIRLTQWTHIKEEQRLQRVRVG